MVKFIKTACGIHMDYDLDRHQEKQRAFLTRIGGPEPGGSDVDPERMVLEEDMSKAAAAPIPSSNSSEKGMIEEVVALHCRSTRCQCKSLEPQRALAMTPLVLWRPPLHQCWHQELRIRNQ